MFRLVEQTTTQRTAAAVRAELARRKITKQQFAEDLGWKRTTTWRRLNGSQPFDVNELAAVAEYLGLPIASLIEGPEVAA